MTQQLALIVLVDVTAAARSGTLEGSTYLFDNMRLHGSHGEGTPDLVTAVNGTYWTDGSQADEQVLNWLPCSLGAMPPTLPRNYHTHRARAAERNALATLRALATSPPAAKDDVATELSRISSNLGTPSRYRSPGRTARGAGHVALPVTESTAAGAPPSVHATHSHPAVLITNIFGEAVDKNIIFPGQYGSPDLVTDGWYWSATVDTSRPGDYSYMMEIEIHRQGRDEHGWVWEPLRLTHRARLRITSLPKRNAFTGAGISALPIPFTQEPTLAAGLAATP